MTSRFLPLPIALLIHGVFILVLMHIYFMPVSAPEDVLLRVDLRKKAQESVRDAGDVKAKDAELARVKPRDVPPAPRPKTRRIELADSLHMPRPNKDGVAVRRPPQPKDLANRLGAQGAAFGKYIENLRKCGLDVVLVCDTTESMAPVLDTVKRKINVIITVLKHFVPDVRIGMVTYRDAGSTMATRSIDLTSDFNELKRFLATIKAGPGTNLAGQNDWEEAVHLGLRAALSLSWRPKARRVILIIADATCRKDELQAAYKFARLFRKKYRGVVDVLYVPTFSVNNVSPGLRVMMTEDQVRLIVARQLERERNCLRAIAHNGGGEFAEISTVNRLIQQIISLAFGTRWRADVDRIYKTLTKEERL